MNILIVGLGAIGSIYATKFYDCGLNIKVLLDRERLIKYKKNGRIFNDKMYNFEYILPENTDYKADLILIAVKSYNLNEVIKNIKNFVTDKTIILSLLNGISSENIIRKAYPFTNVKESYFIGHASMRNDNKIIHDGIGKIVFSGHEQIEKLFNDIGIEYEVPEDIVSAMWQKFIINIGVNQTTAILNQPYSCFERKEAREIAYSLMKEGIEIAKKKKVLGYKNFINNAFDLIDNMPKSCKTSMMQDIEKGIKTEVDIFSGEVCRLGKENGIKTPKNEIIYQIIKNLEKGY